MNLTPVQKTDKVLDILKGNKPYTLNKLISRLVEADIDYTDAELRIALRQASEDGYIYSERNTGNLTITLKGFLFAGYARITFSIIY